MFARRQFLAAAPVALLASTSRVARAEGSPLRVATDATFPPMEFVETGRRTGFDVEMVEAVAKIIGRSVEWVDIDFKGLIPGLIAHRFDMAVSAIYITDERRRVVDFTKPYYAGGLVAMIKNGNDAIKAPADLAGKRVAVQVGTKSVKFLADNFPKAERVEVEKNDEMFNLVAIGRADAAVTGKPAAFQYVRTRGGLHVLEPQLTTEEYGMALRKDEADVTKAVDAAIDTMHANGTYGALTAKWFPTAA